MPADMPESGLPSLGRWTRCPGGRKLRLGLLRLAPEGPRTVGMIQSGDELILLIDVRSPPTVAAGPARLTVEWWRGEQRRDLWQRIIAGPVATVALRLAYGANAGGSSRLRCRVLVDGWEAASVLVLQGRPEVDAQGRLSDGGPARASTATLLAYLDELQRQVRTGRDEGLPT